MKCLWKWHIMYKDAGVFQENKLEMSNVHVHEQRAFS